jgi:drug/metabolite transporter (DMT)-like permease
MQPPTEQRVTRQVLLGIACAFGAAISYGASQVLTRHSVSDLAPPLTGSAIALCWGTLGFFFISARGLREPSNDFRRGALLFVCVGIFSSLGVVGLFQALERGPVVLVSPVVSVNPLFTLLFAALLLREVERITAQVVLGALLVVAGVVVLTVG